MRKFFTSQEKRNFMLLSAISIFVVIISVITLNSFIYVFSMSCLLYVASSKSLFSIFVEIIRIFRHGQGCNNMMQDCPAAHNHYLRTLVFYM